MRFHFIGICGAGMSAVAKLLVDQGHTVTGSDEGFYPPVSLYLTANNIPCTTPFSKENIPECVDYIVIGKHAKLIPEENEEVAFAFSSGKKILSFPEVLTMLVEHKQPLVIAGSYGKSSCTALMSWCLEQGGVDASYFIGAVPLTPNINAHLGKSEFFVIEGDEYPSSNWDSTSKFLHYHAHDVLLTALAHDHVNIFKTHEDYIQPFISLIEKLPEDGKLIVCIDDETIRSTIAKLTRPYITYGLTKDATWYGDTISYGHTTTFNLMKNGELVTTLSTTLLGAHNIQNIIGVSAMLLEKN
jgi:UDP-N-acetylmuramate: L-alanyl-gamma-D-glutamyl-meso-diaminopimelate ligase